MPKSLNEYLPNHLRDIREFKAINEAEQIETDALHAEIDAVLDNQFINDANEDGLARYEEEYAISKQPLATLDERKFAILFKINEQTPYTERALNAQLSFFCGEDGYSYVLSHNDYSISVKLALSAKNNFNIVEEMLERMLPCNLSRTVTLMYNQYQATGQYTHAALSAYTHTYLRNEVME